MRLSNIILLHKPSPGVSHSAVEVEHRKRLWWTSYCLDRITSIEMDKPSGFSDETRIDYPTSEFLSIEDRNEFSEPEYLTAQVRLTVIKVDIVTTVSRLKTNDPADVQRIFQSKLESLESWKTGLSPHMIFDFEHGIPQEMIHLNAMRSLASLYLRFNQVSR
jgi:proline utilization trans-activator